MYIVCVSGFQSSYKRGLKEVFHWTSKGSNVHIYEKRTFSYFVTSQYHRLVPVSFNFLIKFKAHWEIVKKMAEKKFWIFFKLPLFFHQSTHCHHSVALRDNSPYLWWIGLSKIGFSGIFSAQNWVSGKRFNPLHFSIMALLKTQKLAFGSYIPVSSLAMSV